VTSVGIADPALRFWLDYIEAEGGLCDVDGDKALALLSESARGSTGLPEEVVVTADPEVAREDGALLLIPGHPALDHAVERVLQRGDVLRCELEWPPHPPPASSSLLARAREDIAVHHGRIDLGREPPSSAHLPVLRLGAVVTYWTSLERFQEREEVWVDARSGVALRGRALECIRGAPAAVSNGASRRVLAADLSGAVAGAHGYVDEAVAARQVELGRHSRYALEQEVARASAYYDAALQSIANRRESAEAERRPLLDAQVEATRVERSRRLKEIEDKFQPRHEIRPFRLHLVQVPVVELPVVIHRGPREFPFPLIWVPCASAFLPQPCPHCGKPEPLVAAKHRLGCRSCLQAASGAPARSSQPRPQPDSDPSASQPAAAHVPQLNLRSQNDRRPQHPLAPKRKAAASRIAPTRSVRSNKGPGAGRVVEKSGDKLARALWRATFEQRKWRAKAMAAHSPMSAMTRLYGPDAAARALGLPPEALPLPSTLRVATSPGRPPRPHSTAGIIWGTDRLGYRFTLHWHSEAGVAMLAETLAGFGGRERALPNKRDLPPGIAARLFEGAPPPRIDLDPVARSLWDAAIPSHGLLFVARCLCVWWRIADSGIADRLPAPELAAGVRRWVAERSRLGPPDQPAGSAPEVEKLIGPEAVTW